MSGQFIIVRSDALQDPELLKSPSTFMTLCAISTMTSQNKGGWCFFKQETIAKQLSKSRQAISQHLNKLRELGYLEIREQSYKGRQSNNLYRLVYDIPPPTVQGELAALVQGELAPSAQGELAPSAQGELAPKRLEYIKDKKEKGALTRDEFLRAVDQGVKDGVFEKFKHLTETEIFCAAEDCLDFYGAKGEWPAGEPAIVLRHWIKGGVASGKIRKASQEVQVEVSETKNLPDWQKEALEKGIFKPAEFKSWIQPLEWNGNGMIHAPSQFFKERIETQYMSQLRAATHSEIKIEVKEAA